MPFHISRQRLAVLKTTLRNISPAIGSSHANEALAFAFGYKTHASLLAALGNSDDANLEVEFHSDRLLERLEQLDYGFSPYTLQQISMLMHEAWKGEAMVRFRDAAAHPANDNDSNSH